MKRGLTVLMSIIVAGLCLLPAYQINAESINTQEARVISYAKQDVNYKGKVYRATSSALNRLENELSRSDVRLNKTQADRAISKYNAGIAEGIAKGYLVEVKQDSKEEHKEKPQATETVKPQQATPVAVTYSAVTSAAAVQTVTSAAVSVGPYSSNTIWNQSMTTYVGFMGIVLLISFILVSIILKRLNRLTSIPLIGCLVVISSALTFTFSIISKRTLSTTKINLRLYNTPIVFEQFLNKYELTIRIIMLIVAACAVALGVKLLFKHRHMKVLRTYKAMLGSGFTLLITGITTSCLGERLISCKITPNWYSQFFYQYMSDSWHMLIYLACVQVVIGIICFVIHNQFKGT